MTEGAWTGWTRFEDADPGTFLSVIGPSYARAEGPQRASVAVETRGLHRNRIQALHGGFIAAFADHAGFAAMNVLGHAEHINGVTIDLHLQYLGAGRVGPPLMTDVEILRETGRMFFMRMLFRQEDAPIASAAATLRKVSKRA